MLNAQVGGTEEDCVEMTPQWLELGSETQRTWGTGTGYPQVTCSCLLGGVCIHICASQLQVGKHCSAEWTQGIVALEPWWSKDVKGRFYRQKMMFFVVVVVINPSGIFRKAIKVLVSSLLSHFLLQADLPKQDTCMYVCFVPKRFGKEFRGWNPKNSWLTLGMSH